MNKRLKILKKLVEIFVYIIMVIPIVTIHGFVVDLNLEFTIFQVICIMMLYTYSIILTMQSCKRFADWLFKGVSTETKEQRSCLETSKTFVPTNIKEPLNKREVNK